MAFKDPQSKSNPSLGSSQPPSGHAGPTVAEKSSYSRPYTSSSSTASSAAPIQSYLPPAALSYPPAPASAEFSDIYEPTDSASTPSSTVVVSKPAEPIPVTRDTTTHVALLKKTQYAAGQAKTEHSQIKPDDFPKPSMPVRSQASAKPTVEALPPLNPKTERLIEIVCVHMSSPPEEIKELKERARREPEAMESFFTNYYNEHIRPEREKVDPLAEAISKYPQQFCFKYTNEEGISVVLAVDRLAHPHMEVYHGKHLKPMYPDDDPFVDRDTSPQKKIR